MNTEAQKENVANPSSDDVEANSGVTFTIEEFTPERASEIVDQASNFRKDKNAIATYAHAMSGGQWILNGQPVIFDRGGRLLDGYQRLSACVMAGVPFRTIVARNVSEDTLHTIDQHRRRSYLNVLESRGIREAGSILRLMSKMIKIENGSLGKENLPISWSRYDRVLNANPELVEAVELSRTVGKSDLGLKKAARPPLAFMAIMAKKAMKVKDFLHDMQNSGLNMENPARMLSSQFKYSRQRKLEHDIDETIALAVLAFNDYAAGKKATENYFWAPDLGSQNDKKKDAINWGEVRKTAAANLGFPLVDGYGYPGIREGKVKIQGDSEVGMVDDVNSPMDNTIAMAVSNDAGKEEVRLVLVTPELAGEWLRYNDGNRNIQQSHVDAIARDIERGNWMVNAQPICFTTDPENPKDGVRPRLLNGQHRLYAIMKAQIPVEVPIAFNIPEEAFATFDTHAKRAVNPKAARVDDRVMAAAAKFQWREDNGIVLFDSKDQVPSPSSSEIRETLERHPNLMEGFSRSRRKDMLKIATAGVMTYFIYRIRQENQDYAEEFLDGLETGVGISAGSPVLRARNQLRDSDRSSRKETLKLLLSYWEAFQEWKRKEKKSPSKAEDAEAREPEMLL